MTRALRFATLVALLRLGVAALLRVSHDGSWWLLLRSLSPLLVGTLLTTIMFAVEADTNMKG